jgi:hypothetical protein
VLAVLGRSGGHEVTATHEKDFDVVYRKAL